MGSHLAVSAGAFRRSETHEGPGAGEVVIEFLGLAFEEHIFLGVENEGRTGDFPRLFCCPFPDIHDIPTSYNHGSMVSRAMRCNLPSYRTAPIHLGYSHTVVSLVYHWGYGVDDVFRWYWRLHSV